MVPRFACLYEVAPTHQQLIGSAKLQVVLVPEETGKTNHIYAAYINK